jgi:O-antigen/teichoic acid export membrane protein
LSANPGAAASRGVLGRGSIYTLGTAAPILANLAVTPAVTRLLGGPAYGVVATAMVVIQVGMMVGGLGMPAVITRHGILSRTGMEGARALLVRGSLMSTALGLALMASSPLWLPYLPSDLGASMVLAVAASTCFVVVGNAQALLRALDQPGPFVSLSLTATLGGPLLGLGLLVGGHTPERYLTGIVIGYAVAAVVGLWLGLRDGATRGERGDTRSALRLGLPVVPHLVALFLASGALVFLAGHLFGRTAAGRLQVALLIGSSPGVLIAALNNSWAPIVYRADDRERGAVLAHTARDVAALAALICGGVALLSPWLLRLVAGAGLSPDPLVPAVAIVAFGAVVSVAYLANVHLVFAVGRSLGLSLVTPLSLAVGLAVALAVGRNDLVLLSTGFTMTYVALAVGTAVLRRRVGGAQWREDILLPPLLAGGLLCLVGALLPVDGPAALSRLAAALVAGAATLWLGRRVLKA